MNMHDPIFRATFSRHASFDEGTVSVLQQTEDAANEGELLQLIEITDVCATFGVSAEVFDADGRKVGTVDANGNYSMT